MTLEGIHLTPLQYEGDTVSISGGFGVVLKREGRPPTATVDTEPLCRVCRSVLEYGSTGWICKQCDRIVRRNELLEYCRNREAWQVVSETPSAVDPRTIDDQLPPGADLLGAAAELRLAALPTRVVHLPQHCRPGSLILGVKGGPSIGDIHYGHAVVLDWPRQANAGAGAADSGTVPALPPRADVPFGWSLKPAGLAAGATPPLCNYCPSPLVYDEHNSGWNCRDHGLHDSRNPAFERFLRPLDWPLTARITPEPFCRRCARPYQRWGLQQSDWECSCGMNYELSELAEYLARTGSSLVQGDNDLLLSKALLLGAVSGPSARAMRWALRNFGETLTIAQCRAEVDRLATTG